MNNLISIQNQEGQLVVTSRQVAEHFEKDHRNVIRDIEGIAEGMLKIEHTPKTEFIESEYQHEQNKQTYKEYLLTRDGFTLLAMGFTGQKALEWKLKYIEAFNKMDQQLRNPSINKLSYDYEIEALTVVSGLMELSKREKVKAVISIMRKYNRPTLGLDEIFTPDETECSKLGHSNAVEFISKNNPSNNTLAKYYAMYYTRSIRQDIVPMSKHVFCRAVRDMGYTSKAIRFNGTVKKCWN